MEAVKPGRSTPVIRIRMSSEFVSIVIFLGVVKGVKGSYRFARPSDRELKANSLVDEYLYKMYGPLSPLTTLTT